MTVRWWLWDVPEAPPSVPDLLAPPMVPPDRLLEQEFLSVMSAHDTQLAALSLGFMATEEPGRVEIWMETEPSSPPGWPKPTRMRKVPSLADKRQAWVAGTITLDQWLTAVDAASLADLDRLPRPPWRQPWWKRLCARVLTILAGRHPVV